jgi:hypothetical protein
MASFRFLRVVAFPVIAAFLGVPSFGETSGFRVDESQIRFRLGPHPVVEIPVVNTSGKALSGNFKLELLATDDSVESVVTGTFPATATSARSPASALATCWVSMPASRSVPTCSFLPRR